MACQCTALQAAGLRACTEMIRRHCADDARNRDGDNVLRMARRDLNVLDAANRAADRIDRLIDRSPGRGLISVNQLRRSARAVGSNIVEAFGRGTPGDCARVLRIARGEAEEAMQHLHDNLRAARISEKEYWATRNLEAVVVKMLNALIDST